MPAMTYCRLLFICYVIYSVAWPSSAQQCGQYETSVECIDLCQTCEYKKGGCAQPAVCIKGCDCILGFFRNKRNQCVPAAFCPDTGPAPAQECPAGEIPVGCIDRCQRCEYKNSNCNQIQVCTPGCNCLTGFLRDSTNKCIPADFCPGTGPGPAQQCPAGEIPVNCVDQCQRCEYKMGNCGQGQACTPGCNCEPGFLRDKTNKCIPADLCSAPSAAKKCRVHKRPVVERPVTKDQSQEITPSPAQQCPDDEKPVKCIDKCQTCEYINGNCTQGAVCTPGCDCMPGFVRNEQMQCISAALCPGFPCSLDIDAGPCYGYFPRFYFNKKTGQCEEFIYGGCEGNANNFEDKKICEIVCKGPPRPQQCPAGEIPVECIDRCQRCEYKTGNCSQILICTPGCNCLPGFLRDSTNKCIPADFCPDQCKSDEQFYPDIPDCKNTCEYINNPGTICPQYFAPRPGCFCKKGLVKSKDGKCVRPENCGPPPPPEFPCLLEKDAGTCNGNITRFYFNKKTGQCEKFIYGGCEGNANNFVDKKLCEIVCKD